MSEEYPQILFILISSAVPLLYPQARAGGGYGLGVLLSSLLVLLPLCLFPVQFKSFQRVQMHPGAGDVRMGKDVA